MQNIITIEPLSPDQFEMYRNLVFESVTVEPLAFDVTLNECMGFSNDFWKSQLSDSPRTNKMLFAKSSDAVVGMIGVRFGFFEKTRHTATIVSLYVKPEERDSGIGTQLFEASLSLIRDKPYIRKVSLTVISSQIAAMKLYKKYGFEIIGIQKNELFYEEKYYTQFKMELHIPEHSTIN